jgi:hypothetical protein
MYNYHTNTDHNFLCNYNNVKIIMLGDYNLPAIKCLLTRNINVSYQYIKLNLMR